MDNNQPSQPTPVTPPVPAADPAQPFAAPQAAAAPQTPPPVAPQPQVQTAPAGGGHNKLWMILGAFIVVALLIGVGIMMYMQSGQGTPEAQPNSGALMDSVKSISTEFDGIKIEDVSADFKEIDADLSSL